MSEKSKSRSRDPSPREEATSRPSVSPQPTSSPPPPTSDTSQTQPLADFMGMLKMKRLPAEGSHDTNEGGDSEKEKEGNGETKKNGDGEREKDEAEEKMETESSAVQGETLVDVFRRDPDAVLKLLESALSMDKLSSLLANEHKQDKKKVEELRSKLEAAYHTLKDCAKQKGTLTAKIEKTNEKIKAKRKQLESLREELKVLGEEELQLKRKRDTSYTNCADLKKKLKSSRDALQQLAMLAPAKNNKGGPSTAGENSQST